MKRVTDMEQQSFSQNQMKRSKSTQACSSCRKLKTRCELLDVPSNGPCKCHRCKVLNVACSFESLNFAPPRQHHLPAAPLIPQPPSQGANDNHKNAKTQRQASSNSPKELPVSEIRVDLMKPDDIFAQPPNTSWGGLVHIPGSFDWMATPLFAMQNVTSRAPSGEDVFMDDVDVSLSGVLNPDRVQSLLNIFESNYSPWLNLRPGSGGNSTMLTLARCMVASRHLDSITCASIVPQLQKVTEEAIFRHVFNPIPSIESIEAILILSLWTPIGGHAQGEGRDGRLLIASGVSMAMNLRLNYAVEHAAEIYKSLKNERDISDSMASDLDDATDKARLWLTLINVDSMLCIGTGRALTSRRTPSDYVAIESSSCATVQLARDKRLALTGQILEITASGLRMHLSSKSDIDKFFHDVVAVLTKSDELQMLISPLLREAEHEIFHFHILQIYRNACRLLFLHHCLRSIRRVVQDDSGRPWYLLTEYNGVNLAASWGQESILLAEGILSSALSLPEPKWLSTAPDQVFALLFYGAAFVIMGKISTYYDVGTHHPGSSDALLAKFTDMLLQVACGPDHAPMKCARLISALMRGLKARMTNAGERQPSDPSLPSYGPGLDYNRLVGSDATLDSSFWILFAESPTSDAT